VSGTPVVTGGAQGVRQAPNGVVGGTSQLVQLPRWGYVALGVAIAVLAAISFEVAVQDSGGGAIRVDTGQPAADDVAVPSGVLRIPASAGAQVAVRLGRLSDRDVFDPSGWPLHLLAQTDAGWFEVDLNALGLADGDYEYEYVIDGDGANPVADPYAVRITRFGGYRGVFTIAGGDVQAAGFRWNGELHPAHPLADNDRLVIYEMPLRWVAEPSGDALDREVGLGTFDEVIFERLDDLAGLGVTAIELLPIADSPDTLNWGYGTRFFQSPDLDYGSPVDLRFLVKRCHQRGIRVLLDVVMNHSKECPLERLDHDAFYLRPGEAPDREGYGGPAFRYRNPDAPARDFQYAMGEFWVREYHIDGFRIDAFKDIDQWDFIQTFRDRVTGEHRRLFPDRPFYVVAEDSWFRAVATQPDHGNPQTRSVVDGIWNFSYAAECRRALTTGFDTVWGQPSRTERITAMVTGRRLWDDLGHAFKPGFTDLTQAVDYVTSHDVEGGPRLLTTILGALLAQHGFDGSWGAVRALVDGVGAATDAQRAAYERAIDVCRGAFVLLMTSPGLPMLLAGEEFGDVHDTDPGQWRQKMSDPVDWSRATYPAHAQLREGVRALIAQRVEYPALRLEPVEFFYFHPAFDQPGGCHVFAYARTGGAVLGSTGQVVVVGNIGPLDFAQFEIPWPWRALQVGEPAPPSDATQLTADAANAKATLSLAPWQVRAFAC
jgi:1,4-alpha-glucan branching enzyme